MGSLIDKLKDIASKNRASFTLILDDTEALIKINASVSACPQIRCVVAPDIEPKLAQQGFSSEDQVLWVQGLVKRAYGQLYLCPGQDENRRWVIWESVARTINDQTISLSKKISLLEKLTDHITATILDILLIFETDNQWYAESLLLDMKRRLLSDVDVLKNEYMFLYFRLKIIQKYCSSSARNEELMNFLLRHFGQVKLNGTVCEQIKAFSDKYKGEWPCLYLRKIKNWPTLAELLINTYCDLPDTYKGFIVEAVRKDNSEKQKEGKGELNPEAITILGDWYKAKIQAMKIDFYSDNNPAEMLPIVPVKVSPIEAENLPSFSDINWGRIQPLFVDQKRDPALQLYWNEESIKIPLHVSPKDKQPLNISFWLDSSSSMAYDPLSQSGDYHHLLLAVFGTMNWLEENINTDTMRLSVVNFSNETIYSKWKSWEERKSIDKTILHYQAGKTWLNIDMVSQVVEEGGPDVLVIMITDGGFDNGQDIFDLITQKFEDQKRFILIQIGQSSAFSKLIEDWGFIVHTITEAAMLNSLIIGEVKKQGSSGFCVLE